MKVLEAHIINFGKLHDATIPFDGNLTTFLHENGWGKTTLSVFLKSMFYGMEHSTARDLTKNEKKKYSPWQGGIYGGSLTFEHEGKKYRVSRTFSDKANSDTFELIDLATNTKSDDFSSDLGTELFGVSKETYARSAYVTLDEVPLSSDDISAKLNNLVEEGDVSNFETAARKLDEKATAIKAKRRGGSDELTIIQAKIDEARTTLDDIKVRLRTTDDLLARKTQEDAILADLQEEQKNVGDQLAGYARIERKNTYDRLNEEAGKILKNLEETQAFFNGSIPAAETLSNIETLCSELNTVESNLKTQSASQAQKDEYRELTAWFAGDVPSKEQISSCLKTDQDYRQFKQTEASLRLTASENTDYERLSGRYRNADISEESINGFIQKTDYIRTKKDELSALKADAVTAEKDFQTRQQKKPHRGLTIALFILSGVLLVTGLAAFFFLDSRLLMACLPASAAPFGVALIIRRRKPDCSEDAARVEQLNAAISALEKEIAAADGALKAFIASCAPGAASDFAALSTIKSEFAEYSRLREKQKAYEAWLSGQKTGAEYESAIRAFMKRYCKTDDISTVSEDIRGLGDKLNKLETLKNQINSDASNTEKANELKEKLESVLAPYQTDKTLSYTERARTLREKLNALESCKTAAFEARDKLRVFEDEHADEIESYKSLVAPEQSDAELNSAMVHLTDEINDRNRIIASYQKQIDDNLSVTDRQGEIEDELEKQTARKAEKEAEYRLYQKTAGLLKQAKDSLDRNYSKGMIDGFNKYVDMLGSSLELVIDKDLNVSVDSEGQFRDRNFLSEGYKDMVNFCARMALVDALYEDVKPPVILDDPFVNLDDAKVPNALGLVMELSKENQVIYFACHKSRAGVAAPIA